MTTALFTEGVTTLQGDYVQGLGYYEYVPQYFRCVVQRKAKSESQSYLESVSI